LAHSVQYSKLKTTTHKHETFSTHNFQ